MLNEQQIFTVEIDGLNIADQIFNCNDRLFISHPKDADDNISNVFVVIDRPLSIGQGGHAWESEENKKHAKDTEEVLRIVGTFLACYNLVNKKNILEIAFGVPSVMTFHDTSRVLQLVKTGGGCHPYIKSQKPKLSVNETMNSLNSTIPVFEKAISLIEKTNKKIDPLQVALLSYQRSIRKKEVLQDFLGLVTCIESLLSSKEDLRYKFALRTSLFLESEPEKRKEMFDELYVIYGARNKLVHGEDTSAYPYADYYRFELYLEPIVQKLILKYLDLASLGKNKKMIVQELDDIALGFNK